MKVFYNDSFRGYYPVGSSAVLIADNQTEAAELLKLKLEQMGLKQNIDPSDIYEIDVMEKGVLILCDGDY